MISEIGSAGEASCKNVTHESYHTTRHLQRLEAALIACCVRTGRGGLLISISAALRDEDNTDLESSRTVGSREGSWRDCKDSYCGEG